MELSPCWSFLCRRGAGVGRSVFSPALGESFGVTEAVGFGTGVPSSHGVGECLEAEGFQLCQGYFALQLSLGRKVILSLILVP